MTLEIGLFSIKKFLISGNRLPAAGVIAIDLY